MKILFIVSNYPSHDDLVSGVFVQRLVHKISDMGHQCVVVSPVNILKKDSVHRAMHETHITDSGKNVDVYFPSYQSLWINSKFRFDFIAWFSEYKYYSAIRGVVEKLNIRPDVVYAHFVGITATIAARIGERLRIPAFAACGESEFWTIGRYDVKKRVKALNTLAGIISVSTENKERLVAIGVTDMGKIIVLPNGVDTSIYHPIDMMEARKHFNFPLNVKIVGFSGYFLERKGPLRVQQAIDSLNGVYVAYAGKGEQVPIGKNILMCRQLAPTEMPLFLNSLDVFVLPTLHEGCSNAIVEAVACGVPVISSDRPFNQDILTRDYAELVNPENVEEIRAAIIRIVEDKSRMSEMRRNAVEKGRSFDINFRAFKIIEFIKDKGGIYE